MPMDVEMLNGSEPDTGVVISLWRYPVKSMLGEELAVVPVGERGLLGDRAYALLDADDRMVATAKNPRKWPTLFAFSASLALSHCQPRPVRIKLPDGTSLSSDEGSIDQMLSKALGRAVILAATENGRVAGIHSVLPASSAARAEEYWPDIEGLSHRDTVTDFLLPAGTFFDCATVHLLTTATLDKLRDSYPQGRFDIRRFRPNIVVEPASDEEGFAENAWIGRTLAIGDEVQLNVTKPCGRCVMTTLAQGGLPKDSHILRTAVESNQGCVGVYATVARAGTVRCGDRLRLL